MYIGGTDPAVILELSPKSNHSDKPTIDKQPSFKKKQLRRSNEQIGRATKKLTQVTHKVIQIIQWGWIKRERKN